MGFELATPASDRSQTLALDRSALSWLRSLKPTARKLKKKIDNVSNSSGGNLNVWHFVQLLEALFSHYETVAFSRKEGVCSRVIHVYHRLSNS
jgi:hypothetical protein